MFGKSIVEHLPERVNYGVFELFLPSFPYQNHPFSWLSQLSDDRRFDSLSGQLYLGKLLKPEAGRDEEGNDGLISDAEVVTAKSGLIIARSEHGEDILVGVGLDTPLHRWPSGT